MVGRHTIKHPYLIFFMLHIGRHDTAMILPALVAMLMLALVKGALEMTPVQMRRVRLAQIVDANFGRDVVVVGEAVVGVAEVLVEGILGH